MSYVLFSQYYERSLMYEERENAPIGEISFYFEKWITTARSLLIPENEIELFVQMMHFFTGR